MDLRAHTTAACIHSGNAPTHYANGLRDAKEYLAMYGTCGETSSGAIYAYLTANPNNASNAVEQINEQDCAATLLNEYESLANWRRTDYPNLTPVNYPASVTGGTIP